MAKAYGVLCLEGDWNEHDPTDRATIEPALELLERFDHLRLHHRNVNSKHELWRHLDRWTDPETYKTYKDFYYLYLGFHGSPDTIIVGDDEVGLDELKRKLAGRCHDTVLFFASCGVLRSADDSLRAMCRETGAHAIVGYTENVDFLESAAFELLLFPRLLNTQRPKSLFKSMMANYPDLSRKLGFRVATSKWVSSID